MAKRDLPTLIYQFSPKRCGIYWRLNIRRCAQDTCFTHFLTRCCFAQGRALVWPSVLNEDPNSSDTRMYHEAKEVVKGTKYAANHWSKSHAVNHYSLGNARSSHMLHMIDITTHTVHQYDFRNANKWGCNGSFA